MSESALRPFSPTRRAIVGLFLLTLSTSAFLSCAPRVRPSSTRGPIYLSFGTDSPAAGDTLAVTLHNDSEAVLWYNACPRELLRQGPSGSWETAPLPPQPPPPLFRGRPLISVCVASSVSLAPGGVEPLTLVVPTGLPAGVYRFRFAWIPANPEQKRDGPRLLSPAFRIR